MKKRLASKKGFTLVECLVAIVIFSIMALMVSMMYSMSLTTYKNARDIDTDLSAQEHDVVLESRYANKYADSNKESDELKVNFQDDHGNSIVSLSYPFEARKPSAYSEGDSSLLLSYAIANVDYADSAVQESGGGGGGGGGSSIPSDVTPTIYGSSGIKSISVHQFEQIGGDSKKFSFWVKVHDDSYRTAADAPYRQIKISLGSIPGFTVTAISGESDRVMLEGNNLRIGGSIKGSDEWNKKRTALDGANVKIYVTLTEEVTNIKDLEKYFGKAFEYDTEDNTDALFYKSMGYIDKEGVSHEMPGVYAFTQKEVDEDTP